MSPGAPRARKGPEGKIQQELVLYLQARRWVVKETHGNIYQSGLPDLYCAHPEYRSRWIEVKNPVKYEFTKAQREFFLQLTACGIGIWVLTAATEEEYLKLWQPANWTHYLHEMQVISRPRPSLSKIEGYKPKYPTPGLPPGHKK